MPIDRDELATTYPMQDERNPADESYAKELHQRRQEAHETAKFHRAQEAEHQRNALEHERIAASMDAALSVLQPEPVQHVMGIR